MHGNRPDTRMTGCRAPRHGRCSMRWMAGRRATLLLLSAGFLQTPAPQPPATHPQASLVELPPGIPGDALRYTVTMMGNAAGANIAWRTPDGMTHVFFAYNDRGRGPRISESYAAAPDGTLRRFELA